MVDDLPTAEANAVPVLMQALAEPVTAPEIIICDSAELG